MKLSPSFFFAIVAASLPCSSRAQQAPCRAWQSLASATIIVGPDATVQEHYAAKELSHGLANLTGLQKPAVHVGQNLSMITSPDPTPRIAVGPSAAAGFGIAADDFDLAVLGPEGFVATSNRSAALRNSTAGSYVLSGARNATHGTLYAVYHLLHALGLRFFAHDSISAVRACPDAPPMLDDTIHAALEFRNMDGWGMQAHPTHAIRLWQNAQGLRLGGSTQETVPPSKVYASPPGGVHTSYKLLGGGGGRVPPAKLFAQNPEWFWPRNASVYGQLCWSNASLVDYVTQRAKEFLRKQPNANIISVSQNDNGRYCQTPEELRIIEEEGTPGGALYRAVNTIADSLKTEFPNVAVDTLAYQWGRPAPKLVKPRPNVIIRLCSIECNFGAPMTDPSNAKFSRDLVNWGNITQRVYIWDYTTDFGNYVMTFPNYYVVGPNIQFFFQHGVKGLFEEGPPASVGDGPDLQELKEYVMANMMWRPMQDPLLLISEFLEGYYSAAGAPFVRQYMDVMHAAVDETNFYLSTCCTAAPKGTSKAYLHPMSLIAGSQALLAGERATSGDARKRIVKASMSILYPILWNWDEVTSFAQAESIEWSSVMTSQTKQAAWERFATLYNRTGTHMLNNDQGHHGCVDNCPLAWMHDHLFNTSRAGVRRNRRTAE